MKSTSYDLKEKSSRKLQSRMDNSSDFHLSFRTERTVISPKQQILEEITGRKRGLSSSKVSFEESRKELACSRRTAGGKCRKMKTRGKNFSASHFNRPAFPYHPLGKSKLCRSACVPQKRLTQIAPKMVQQSKGHGSIRYFALT